MDPTEHPSDGVPPDDPSPDTADLRLPARDAPAPGGPVSEELAESGGPPMSVRLRDPGDLVAAIPHLIGFRPTESVVLAAVHGRDRRQRLGAVVRTDLPTPEDVSAVVAQCARRLGTTGPQEVALVVVGGGRPGGSGPPRPDIAQEVAEMFATVRVPVRTRLWTSRIESGAEWRCYPPCDCRGTLPVTEESTMAVAATVLGQVTYSSRAELEATVAADPAVADPRRRALIDRTLHAAVLDRELAGPGAAAARDSAAVETAVAEVAAGRPLGDEEVARVAVALGDPQVRDCCIGWALGARADAAEQLWTLLVRAVPAPEVAEPAVLLACSVFLRGGGALVGAALERARRADPDHTLTRLVEGLVERGIGQREFRSWVEGASVEARSRLSVAA